MHWCCHVTLSSSICGNRKLKRHGNDGIGGLVGSAPALNGSVLCSIIDITKGAESWSLLFIWQPINFSQKNIFSLEEKNIFLSGRDKYFLSGRDKYVLSGRDEYFLSGRKKYFLFGREKIFSVED